VQIIYGDADVVTTPPSIALIAAQRPQVPLRVIAGAGHAVYLEQPSRFNQLVLELARAN
jgi:pimeloyl-ACP methyl ester carboxylesterase